MVQEVDSRGSGLETTSLDLSLDVCTASKFFAFSSLLEARLGSLGCGLGHILSRFAECLARLYSELPPAGVVETALCSASRVSVFVHKTPLGSSDGRQVTRATGRVVLPWSGHDGIFGAPV